MAEPRTELIKAALKARLESIAADGGVTYWYQPSVDAQGRKAVYRCYQEWDDAILDRSLGTDDAPAVIYAIRSDKGWWIEHSTGQQLRGELEVFILAARADVEATVDPRNQAAPRRELVADRLTRDVIRVLATEPQLVSGNEQVSINVMKVPDGIEVVTFDHEGWVVCLFRTVIPYRCPAGAP